MASRSDYISRQRTATQALIAALNEHINLKRQYDALGYANATTGLVDADFVGENSGITAADFKAAVLAAAELNSAFSLGGTVAANVDKKLYVLR